MPPPLLRVSSGSKADVPTTKDPHHNAIPTALDLRIRRRPQPRTQLAKRNIVSELEPFVAQKAPKTPENVSGVRGLLLRSELDLLSDGALDPSPTTPSDAEVETAVQPRFSEAGPPSRGSMPVSTSPSRGSMPVSMSPAIGPPTRGRIASRSTNTDTKPASSRTSDPKSSRVAPAPGAENSTAVGQLVQVVVDANAASETQSPGPTFEELLTETYDQTENSADAAFEEVGDMDAFIAHATTVVDEATAAARRERRRTGGRGRGRGRGRRGGRRGNRPGRGRRPGRASSRSQNSVSDADKTI